MSTLRKELSAAHKLLEKQGPEADATQRYIYMCVVCMCVCVRVCVCVHVYTYVSALRQKHSAAHKLLEAQGFEADATKVYIYVCV